MEEENLQNQNDIEAPDTEPISKTDAMVGIFTEPGNTYEAVAQTKGVYYWTYPILICILLGLISAFIGQTDAQLFGDMMSKQKKKMHEKMDEQVKAGKLTQEQAQEQIAASEKFMDPNGIFFKLMAYVGASVGVVIIFIFVSLLYFVGLKIFKSQAGFADAMNVVGLGMLISSIGGLLAMVLSVVMGHFTSIGAGLFLKEENVGEKAYKFATSLDIFAIWEHVIFAIGLSKVGRISMAQSYSLVFGIWFIWMAVSIFVF